MPAVRAQQRFSTADYRRCARRLRSIFHRQPGQLQRSLRQLADAVDHTQDEVSGPVRAMKSARVSQFQSIIRNALNDRPLRYSRRVQLLKTAEVLGIGQFEANLILAIEQNKIEPGSIDPPCRSWFPAVAVMIAGAIQSILCIAAYWLVRA